MTTFLLPYFGLDLCSLGLYVGGMDIVGRITHMPKPGKYKSVALNGEAYDKLVYISDKEDRAMGRQLGRMIDETYEVIIAKENAKRGFRPTAVGIGGLSSANGSSSIMGD
jgi:hypothetical protein